VNLRGDSQAEAALTIIVFLVSAMARRAFRGQSRIVRKPPEEQVLRAKEPIPQPANSVAGSGSKNSGPTRSLPFNDPG